MNDTNFVDVRFPTARMISGNLYEPSDKDMDGKPRLIRSGPNVGQPLELFQFGIAIAKTAADAGGWWLSEWGAKILTFAHSAFPGGQAQLPSFSWKIQDGDSQVPNTRGRKPADAEGRPGHWIVWFSSQMAPKITNGDGSAYINDKDVVKAGFYIQVYATIRSNGQQTKPGIHVNATIVAFRGIGPEIRTGPDPKTLGLGQDALPPGATPVTAWAGTPGAPAPASVPTPTPAIAPAAFAAPPPAAGVPPGPARPPVGVVPSASFVGAVPGAPPPPAAAPAPPGKTMTAKAGTIPYDAYIAKGWTDAQLIAGGLMLP